MFELARKRNQPLILVADDDRSIRTMATDALQAQGYAVVEAEDGEQALELFRRHSPSLVILDVTMPGMDGLSACRELRRSYPELAVPVLVLTGAEAESSVDRAYEAGATDFLNKPVSATLLCHRIRYLLRASDAVLQLRQSQESLANAQRIARLGSWKWDADTGVMQWSDETYRICGMEPGPAEVSFERMARCVHPDDLSVLREEMNGVLEQGKRFSVEHRILLPGGEVRHVHQRGELVGGGPLDGRWLSGTIQDVTDQVHTQEKIRHLARYDSLTNLANRRLFKEQLARAIEAAEMHNHLVGLLYMDLDRFKQVNDTLGHSAGDELLKEVAERLRHHVRGSDLVSRGNKLSVSRLGGDEFTVLLSKISAAEDAGEVARRVLRALPVPVRIEGHDVSPHISIGVAIYPLDGQDVDTLMKSADAAMYHAKEGGRNRYQFFSESMNAASLRKLTLESRLREAVQRDELCLHYQPRVDLATGTVVGTEALLRWEHPVLGMVSPVEFIPVSEESGLIISIGRWVLDTACAQNKAWQDAGHRAVRVSVNVS
ncbi:MAG: diguanylate cyclase, partial [Proteobacteria bacterium]|nr:diguanylate cyclase [Pseudomonadota bacterium]